MFVLFYFLENNTIFDPLTKFRSNYSLEFLCDYLIILQENHLCNTSNIPP